MHKYLDDINELSPETKSSSLKEISNLLEKANTYSEDKKEIARQLYDMVDKHIRRLDQELSKFEYENKSENTVEEENVDNKRKKRSQSTSKSDSNFSDTEENTKNSKFFQGVKRINSSPRDLADMDIDPSKYKTIPCYHV